MRRIIGVLLLLLAPLCVDAAEVSEAPEEARVRALAIQLRCPVCQSENILDSQASTAKEMVVILRERIAEDMNDDQILEFFRSRYGNYVPLSPPTTGVGRVIWLIPIALTVLGTGVFGWIIFRNRRRVIGASRAGAVPLTETNLREMDL